MVVLLLVQQTTGSFAEAGAVGGALSVGNAVGLVVSGRLIDRYGLTVVLLSAAGLCPMVLIGLTWSADRYDPVPLVGCLAVVAGAALPPTTTGMPLVVPRLIAEPPLRATAYALLATQFQIAMVLGPLIVSRRS